MKVWPQHGGRGDGVVLAIVLGSMRRVCGASVVAGVDDRVLQRLI